MVKYDNFFYEKDDQWHPVAEYLYTGNVVD
jgi:hypothetical protein